MKNLFIRFWDWLWSWKKKKKRFEGKRAIFKVNGKAVPYTGGVTGGEELEHEPVDILELLSVEPSAECVSITTKEIQMSEKDKPKDPPKVKIVSKPPKPPMVPTCSSCSRPFTACKCTSNDLIK